MATTALTIRSAPNKPARSPQTQVLDVVDEFAIYFGNESRLANWQRLCGDVGLAVDLPSIKQCRAALKGVFVNIFDLIDANKTGTLPRMFESKAALAKYSLKNKKIFPKRKAKKGGPVAALLIHIF